MALWDKISIPSMTIWAMRDLNRNSGKTVLLFSALFALVCVVATSLLLTETLAVSSETLLNEGPSLVIRKVTSGGWTTIPSKDSIEAIESIPGVLAVRARIWGLSTVFGSPITLVGVVEKEKNEYSINVGPGEGIAGAGLALSKGDLLELGATEKHGIQIVDQLPASVSTVLHDVLLIPEADCRRILGIPAGDASDLVVDVFHESEEKAIIADLAAALPFPVQVVTRTDMISLYRGGLSRRGGISLLLVVPALLSLVLLVVTMMKQGLDSRKEMGILKSMGWTSRDIARFHFWKAVLIGLPAVILGAVMAYALIFTPAVRWVSILFLGWQGQVPVFAFSSQGSLSLLVMVSCLVFFPFLAAVTGPVLLSSTSDPVELIRKD